MKDSEKVPVWKRLKKSKISAKKINRRAKRVEKNVLRHTRKFITSRLDRLADVRREIIGWVVLVLILVMLSAAQWLFFRDAYTHDAPQTGGTYSEGVVGPLETLNPLLARSSAEKSAAKLMFASLYSYDKTGAIKGDLAEKVIIGESLKEYTITLRSGAKWSDGQDLTADDVIFTVNLMKNPAITGLAADWSSVVVKKVNDHTVMFTNPAVYAPFLHTLTFSILPKHILGEVSPSELRDHSFSTAPVTSGPFTFRLLQNSALDGSKKIVHMNSNPEYYRGQPKLERFQLYVYSSRDEVAKGLRVNEIMATPELSYAVQSDQVKQNYQVDNYSLHNGVYALFNTKREPLNSTAVRQALSRAINQVELRKKLSQVTAPLDGPLLSDQLEGELPDATKYDLAAAKKLLDEAGWQMAGKNRQKDGKKMELTIVSLRGDGFENAANQLATIWRSELGVNVTVQIVDPSDATQDVLRTVLQPREFDVLIHEFALGSDPDVYAFWYSSQDQRERRGLNFANYNSAVVDDALVSGRSKLSLEQRSDVYRVMVRRWLADAPAVPLYRSMVEYIHSSSVSSIADGSKLISPVDRYANVIDWTARQEPVYKTP